jgi:curved DNA-binding protein CbpA
MKFGEYARKFGGYAKSAWRHIDPHQRKPQAKAPLSDVPVNVDLYDVLEVPPDATDEEIRAQYREVAKLLHPDRNPGNEKAQKLFAEVTAAYNVLSNKDKRAAYDAARASAGQTPKAETKQEAPKTAQEAQRAPSERPKPRASWEEIAFSPRKREERDVLEFFRPSQQQPRSSRSGAPFEEAAPSRPGPDAMKLAEWLRATWDLNAIWGAAEKARADRRFAQYGAVALTSITGADAPEYQLAEALGVPDDVLKQYESRRQVTDRFWNDYLFPLFELFPEAMKSIQPREIPGYFYLQGTRGGVDLYYMEPRR